MQQARYWCAGGLPLVGPTEEFDVFAFVARKGANE